MKKQVLFSLAAAALLASSCSSDEPVLNGGDSYLRVNGTINEVKSRATDTSFDDNDVIGVSAQNVAYVYGNSGFAAQGEGIKVAETTTLSAYYPYTAELSNNEIEFDVAANQVVDFLFAPAVQVSPENPVANFQFSHKMSKIAFTVVDADNQFTDATLSLTLTNVATTGKFNTSDGSVTANAANGTLTSDITAGTAKSFIVPSFAQENNEDINVTVSVSTGEFYVATITPALAAGTQYNYKLTIKKNSPDMSVGGTIDGWQSEDEDIDMDKGEEPYVLAVGDYLLKNGKTIAPSKLDGNQSNVVAVVYYVGNANNASGKANGLAISLNNATPTRFGSGNANYSTWATNHPEQVGELDAKEMNVGNNGPADTQYMGYNNTQIIKKAQAQFISDSDAYTYSAELISALEAANEISVANASEWYLPNFGEFALLTANLDMVNKSIEAAGGVKMEPLNGYTRTDSKSGFYWTSTLRGNNIAWISILGGEAETTDLYQTRNTNSISGYFRFAVAF